MALTLLRPVSPSAGAKFPLIPPSAPTAWDDEFTSPTLDPKWTWFNQAGASAQIVDGTLALKSPNNAGLNVQAMLLQPAPAPPWTIESYFAVQGPASGNSWKMGLALHNSGNGFSLDFGRGFVSTGSTLPWLGITEWSSFNVVNLAIVSIVNDIVRAGTWQPMFHRIEHTGTSLRFSISTDGNPESFMLLATRNLAAGMVTVTHFGFGAGLDNVNFPQSLRAYYFRRVA